MKGERSYSTRIIIIITLLLLLLKETNGCSETTKKLLKTRPKLWLWNGSKMEFINGIGCEKKAVSPFYSSIENVTIQVVAFPMDPYIEIDADKSTIGGFLGDMWTILEEVLKFQSNITTTRFNVGRDMIKRHEAEVFLAALVYTKETTDMYFSQPYFRNWYHLYFKLLEGKPAQFVHFQVFNDQLWACLLALFTFLTVTLWTSCTILRRVGANVENRLSMPTYFMGVISAFLNTGYDLKLRSVSGRLQILSALICGVLCYYALSANLVATLAVLSRPLPFKSLDGIAAQRTYSLCLRNITFVYDNLTAPNHLLLPKWRSIVNTEKCPRNMLDWKTIPSGLCQDNVAVLENRIIMGLALPRAQCEVTLLPHKYFDTGNYIAYSTKFAHKKPISIMMLRMRSTGIASKLEDKWVKSGVPQSSKKMTTGANQITFSHVKGLICIYFYLIAASVAILLLELCTERTRNLPENNSKNFSTP